MTLRQLLWRLLAIAFVCAVATDIMLELSVRENLTVIEQQKQELRAVYEQKAHLQRALSLYQLGCHTPAVAEEPPSLEAWTSGTVIHVVSVDDFCSTAPPRHEVAQ